MALRTGCAADPVLTEFQCENLAEVTLRLLVALLGSPAPEVDPLGRDTCRAGAPHAFSVPNLLSSVL